MKNTKLVSQDVVNRDRELTGIVETSKDVLNTAQRDVDQHRWEQVKCPDGPRHTMTAYAKAVGLKQPAISHSVRAWEQSLSYDNSCSDSSHGGTELTESEKPTPEDHKRARDLAHAKQRGVAIAEGIISAFGTDNAVSTVSRNSNWRNTRNAVKALIEYAYPGDVPAQVDGAQAAADEVRTEWLRIEMVLEKHGVWVPTADTMLDRSHARWEREPEFSFRTAVDTELASLATELKAEAKKREQRKSAHSIRYMEASTSLTDIRHEYANLLDIVSGVKFDDEERELLGADLAEVHGIHLKVVNTTDTEDVIIGIQMDALTNTEE